MATKYVHWPAPSLFINHPRVMLLQIEPFTEREIAEVRHSHANTFMFVNR